MSKKKRQDVLNEEESRRSRKEVLIAKKEAEQTRGIRIGVGIVIGLILLIIVIALVNELIITPNRAVATVNGETITLSQFRDRVEYERIQRIVFLENQFDAFDGDVGIIQQFASQWIIDLLPDSSDTFGETVLNQMVDEILIEQAAAERGIEISEEDIDEAIGADFGYYGGGLPTPLPTATETVMPTPSLTPIPTAVITEVLPTATSFPTPTDGPTATPFPTATPVSEEAFQEQFNEFFQGYQDLGVTEAQYREQMRKQLLREQLSDALAEEEEMSTEAEHASFFVIIATDETEIEEIADSIAADGFLPVWNEIRSRPFDAAAESTAAASEILRRTQDDLVNAVGAEVANAAFELDIDEPSDVLTAVGQDGTEQYFIIMVSGREMLELSDSALQAKKQDLLTAYLEDMKESNVEINDFWRGRVPTVPRLDPKFLAAPTATPGVVLPEVTVEP